MFDKLIQVLRFGCSYESIADSTCSATTIRNRRDEWLKLGVFAQLKATALETYDRMVGLILNEIAVDGCITKAPGGGQAAGRSPVDRGKKGMKRSNMVDGYGIPLGRVLAGANRHDSPLLGPRWTGCTSWDRCPTPSGSTWTPATTPMRAGPRWPTITWSTRYRWDTPAPPDTHGPPICATAKSDGVGAVSQVVNVHKAKTLAKTRFPKLRERAHAGQEIILAKG